MAHKKGNKIVPSSLPQQRSHTASIQHHSLFLGPIPPPEILKQYNEVIPDAAERILRMSEKQSDHRMSLEKTVVTGDNRRAYIGLVAGCIIALAFLGASYSLITLGYRTEGTILGSVDITGLVSVFIYGTATRRREREGKAKLMAHID